jgi:hypothetical protein
VLVFLAGGGGFRFGDMTEMCVGGLVTCSCLVLLIRLSSAWGVCLVRLRIGLLSWNV